MVEAVHPIFLQPLQWDLEFGLSEGRRVGNLKKNHVEPLLHC